ncbi:MAG TPA: DUF58 domain-containing protein [Syntrophales bacterium]|nr:DUF58 domain-containing protein [Syntrophales bacterium]
MALTLFLGIAAINTGNNLVYMIVAALLSFLLISGFYGKRNLSRLIVDVTFPEEVFARTETLVTVVLVNRRRYLPAFLMRVSLGETSVLFPFLEAGHRATRPARLTFAGRGHQAVSPRYLASSFPFRFFIRYRRLEGDVTALVYPEPKPGSVGREEGRSRSRPSESGLDLSGAGTDLLSIRPYLVGDPLKYIHWKASARTDRLQTKEFTLPAVPPLVLDIARVPGPLEGRLSILTFWVLALFRKGVPVGLKMGEILYPPVHSPHQKHLLLRALALCGHEGEAHEG